MKQNNQELDESKKQLIFQSLNSAEELRDWMYLFFDLYFPMGVVYPTSTHGPVEAMWRIYELFKTGQSAEVPQVCMLSSRDSYKTLCAAALEVLCMIHFRMPCCHMAAIESQSLKAVQYVESFFRKIKPYLEHHGWRKNSDNKRMIEWITSDGVNIYLKIIVATIAGANCIDPNTVIITENGNKLASELRSGEKILTRDFIKNKDIYVSLEAISHTEKESLLIEFDNCSNLLLSTDHKVFTNKGWITADQLKIGTDVINQNLEKIINSDYNINNYIEHSGWDLDQLILGTLLGDSSLYRTPAGSYRYQVSHCAAQLPYIQHIQKIFSNNGIPSNIIPDKKGQFKLTTLTNDIFKKYANLCYLDNKKAVTDKWLDLLAPEGWAYFLMDDGTNHFKIYGKGKENCISFATCGFSNTENQTIIKHLSKFNLNSYIKKVSNSTKKQYETIELDKLSSRVFSEIVSKWVIPILKYKLLTPERHLTLRHYIDTGNVISTYNLMGFKWESASDHTQRKIRKIINSQFNSKVSKITPVGPRYLIDLHINNNNYNLQSFYANGILVHNSEHVPMLCIDEVDVVQNPKALNEAKMIPSTYGNINPLTIYLSTRKFAGGMMEKTLKETEKSGGEVLRWNIIDVTERIPYEVAKPDLPKVTRYISRELPMENLSPDEWKALTDEAKNRFERFEAYAGIADHPLLPVMKHYLVGRPQDDHGFLYKRITAVRNNFRQLPPDMGEAQLLCNKPSSSGLVYSRFENSLNTLTIEQALEKLSGVKHKNNSLEYFKDYLLNLGVTFVGGGDFGFTDYTSLVVLALLPSGEAWLVDSVVEQRLELDDIVKYAKELQSKWNVSKWYMEQAYPAYLVTLRKNGITCPEFKKVVEDGIAALQSRIVDSSNSRKFFIVKQPNTEMALQAFGEYKWAIDGKGDVIEGKPYHDKDGVSDIMDSLRYPFQNLFNKNGKIMFTLDYTAVKSKTAPNQPQDLVSLANPANEKIMKDKMKELVPNYENTSNSKIVTKKKIFWG
jgi:hypothetical protein